MTGQQGLNSKKTLISVLISKKKLKLSVFV